MILSQFALASLDKHTSIKWQEHAKARAGAMGSRARTKAYTASEPFHEYL